MAGDSTEFCSDFEKETGEKVEAQSEGSWYAFPGASASPEGLLILTHKSFRFKYVPDTLRPFILSEDTTSHRLSSFESSSPFLS